MKIILTICSRHKKEGTELLPAEERYTGAHIAKVREIAKQRELPLYFLSGEYGLLFKDAMIPYYDYYLENAKIDHLVDIVIKQIQNEGITDIEFYTKNNDSWMPYKKVMLGVRQGIGIPLHQNTLPVE